MQLHTNSSLQPTSVSFITIMFSAGKSEWLPHLRCLHRWFGSRRCRQGPAMQVSSFDQLCDSFLRGSTERVPFQMIAFSFVWTCRPQIRVVLGGQFLCFDSSAPTGNFCVRVCVCGGGGGVQKIIIKIPAKIFFWSFQGPHVSGC